MTGAEVQAHRKVRTRQDALHESYCCWEINRRMLLTHTCCSCIESAHRSNSTGYLTHLHSFKHCSLAQHDELWLRGTHISVKHHVLFAVSSQ